jgi:hypothetical protein
MCKKETVCFIKQCLSSRQSKWRKEFLRDINMVNAMINLLQSSKRNNSQLLTLQKK